MSQFRFPLGRVLEWYQKVLQLEENRLADCHIALSRAKRALAEARAARLNIEQLTVRSPWVAAGDLQALEQFRRRSLNDEKCLNAVCDASQSKLDAQVKAVKSAQRKVRLLEKLRERRQIEHTYAANRELEQLAADTYLAKFAREQ
jgi:hypothetical protein